MIHSFIHPLYNLRNGSHCDMIGNGYVPGYKTGYIRERKTGGIFYVESKMD